MRHQLTHNISLGVLLFTLWVGLSGHLNLSMLGLGLVSACAIVYLTNRMDRIDREIYPARLTLLLIRFWLFLVREVVRANIDVIKRIFRPGKDNISPQLFELPLTKRTRLSRVIYANAITMTPGTVSVNLDNRTITVHTLSREAAEELRSNRMANAVPEDEASLTP